MIAQTCPNCQLVHDVGVYVTGQKVLCRCGIRFEVRRTDVGAGARSRSGQPMLRLVDLSTAPGPTRPPPPEPAPDLDAEDGKTLLRHEPPPSGQRATPEGDELEGTFVSSHGGGVAIPGYELKELLGRGGMGEVWTAWQRSLGRVVAIKFLPPRLAKAPEFVARFEKEATALASLSHPNVIQIIDRGVAGDCGYFVMELVQGQSLRELMNGRRLGVQEALRLVLQICRAIDYAHEQRIIHRDLKPENILVDERGHVKVADFGLATFRGGESRLDLTATQVAMGTLNYMAPEQRRDARSVDGRADLYSLGVIFYEMLTGELPLGRFKLPSERDPSLEPRLDAIVARALEAEPAARYQRAGELAAALEELVTNPSTLPGVAAGGVARQPAGGPPVPPQRSVIEKGWSGLRAGLTVIGALAVLGVLIKLPLPWGRDPARAPRPAVSWPPNTDGSLFTAAQVQQGEGGAITLQANFAPGDQELNAHSGSWRVEDGKLVATQAGNEIGQAEKLVPRTYVARRYFSSDDFSAEVELSYGDAGYAGARRGRSQRYAELAYRIKGLQVSAFVIPGVGMRLLWSYATPEGIEEVGNSARDVESMAVDEVPAPPAGKPFRLRLTLRRQQDGTLVEAFLDGERFARKLLGGLSGRTAKVALGCRNLRCEFDDLRITGLEVERPTPTAPAGVPAAP